MHKQGLLFCWVQYMPPLSKDRLFELRNQIIMAETINREEIQPCMIEAMDRYMGKFTPKYGYNWDIILNEIYPIIQTNLPAIFFRNPRAFLKPRNKTYIAKVLDPETGKKVDTELDSQKSSNTQEAILNYDVDRMKYKREARKVLMDGLLFPHGVMWHGYKGDFGMTEEQSFYIENGRVFVKRICPTRFIKDPNVNFSNLDEAKWVGRIIDIPYKDFVEDDKFKINKDLIKGFKGFGDKVGSASINQGVLSGAIQVGGGDTYRLNNLKKNLLDFTDEGFRQSKHALFVRVYELYVRPTKKEKRQGSNGRIVVLCFEQPDALRDNDWDDDQNDFPVEVLEFNALNDAMFAMPDIDTYKSIADQKNIITNMQIRNAQENSKVYVAVAGADQDEESITKIQKGEQTILVFKGDDINGKMSVQSGGGQASSELYTLDTRIQKNLDDKSGVTDLRRGVLQSGEESAVSVKLRANASSARPAYRQDIMKDFLISSFSKINKYHKRYLPFEDAVRIIGSMDLQWSDKPTKEIMQADVDVEIDVISMLPEDPVQELQLLQSILAQFLQALTTPEVMQKINQEGKTFNLSPLIEQILLRSKIKDPDIYRNIKPEESMGYSSNQQLMEAKDNVNAALVGQPIPHPPQPNDDHNAKLTIYTEIQQLLQKAGQTSDALNQLIQIQAALLQQQQEEQANAGTKPNLKPPKMVKI